MQDIEFHKPARDSKMGLIFDQPDGSGNIIIAVPREFRKQHPEAKLSSRYAYIVLVARSSQQATYSNIANFWKKVPVEDTMTITTLRVESFAKALVINAIFRGIEEGDVDYESITRELERRLAVTHYGRRYYGQTKLEACNFIKHCAEYMDRCLSHTIGDAVS